VVKRGGAAYVLPHQKKDAAGLSATLGIGRCKRSRNDKGKKNSSVLTQLKINQVRKSNRDV